MIAFRDSFDDPTKSWGHLGKVFVGALPNIPDSEAPELCAWEPESDWDDFPGRNLRRAEAPFLEEIEAVIDELCTKGRCPKPGKEIEYFLGVRARVLQPYLLSLSVRSEHGDDSIFPFPTDKSIGEIYRWFLIDWWNSHGPFIATQNRIVDQVWDAEH